MVGASTFCAAGAACCVPGAGAGRGWRLRGGEFGRVRRTRAPARRLGRASEPQSETASKQAEAAMRVLRAAAARCGVVQYHSLDSTQAALLRPSHAKKLDQLLRQWSIDRQRLAGLGCANSRCAAWRKFRSSPHLPAPLHHLRQPACASSVGRESRSCVLRIKQVRHERPRRAVERVADDRMSQRLHVHADLVGAPGLDAHLDQGERRRSAWPAAPARGCARPRCGRPARRVVMRVRRTRSRAIGRLTVTSSFASVPCTSAM